MKHVMPKPEDLRGRLFIGKVVKNDDPDELERVKVRVPYIYDDIQDDNDLPWSLPIKQRAMGATDSVNSFGVPVIGTDVAVMFDAGERYSPLYLGSVTTSEDLKKIAGTTYGATYGIRDAAGNHLYVDTATKIAEFFHVTGTKITVSPTGAVTVITVDNVNLNVTGTTTLNSTGIVLIHSDADVNIDSAANVNITAATNVSITASAAVSITGTASMTLTVGGSTVTITPASVAVAGPLITLN